MRCEPLDKLFHGSAPSGAHKSGENDRDIRLTRSYVRNPIYPVVYTRSTRLPRLKYFTATLLRELIALLKIMASRIAQLREKIEAMLKALENNLLTAQDITVLRDAYQQMFAPARMPSGPHECLVCHEELLSYDDDDGDHVHSDQCAVSAPGCNHHFAHSACYTKWAMTSGRKECMVCSSVR